MQIRQSSCEISNFTLFTHELRLQRFQDLLHKTTKALGKPSEFIFLLREIDLSMADLVGPMNALSMNGGNADVPPGSPGGNINERGEFIVRGGPENGPIIWNPTTAYIESWNQLPLHPVNIYLSI